jgi:hypothetical protein
VLLLAHDYPALRVGIHVILEEASEIQMEAQRLVYM